MLASETDLHVAYNTDKITDLRDAPRGDRWYERGFVDKEIPVRVYLCEEMSRPQVDVWVYKKPSKKYYSWKTDLNSRELCQFGEVQIYCPPDPVAYVQRLYGRDWRTPKMPGYFEKYLMTGSGLRGCIDKATRGKGNISTS